MLIGVIAMSAIGTVAFESIWFAVVGVAGLVLGWLVRRLIVDQAEHLFWALPGALFVYGVVLFVGERVLGLSGEAQLMIILATTVVVFSIQLWSLSDPSIVNTERE